MFQRDKPVSQSAIRDSLKALMTKIGVDRSKFSFHSTRRGAATEAGRAGLSTEEIKALGRWKSSRMVELYTKRTEEDISNITKKFYAAHQK